MKGMKLNIIKILREIKSFLKTNAIYEILIVHVLFQQKVTPITNISQQLHKSISSIIWLIFGTITDMYVLVYVHLYSRNSLRLCITYCDYYSDTIFYFFADFSVTLIS